MKINAMSSEFPLTHNFANKSPKIAKQEKPSLKMFTSIKNGFNNESPDFFRIDSMKENEHFYKNKFLGEVTTRDRSAFFKDSLNAAKEQIHLIKKIKSDRSLSQNDKLIKIINSSNDAELLRKRNVRNLEENSKVDYNLSNELKEKEKKLHLRYAPKVPFRLKNSYDYEHIKNLNSEKNVNGAYLNLNNDFSIKEAYNFNLEKFTVKEKPMVQSYDCINNLYTSRAADKLVLDKYGDFYKKYIF